MTPDSLITHSSQLSDVIQQLKLSLNTLDVLGFALAAIHVHNAIGELEIENNRSKILRELNPIGCADWARMDIMADELFR